MTNEVEGLDIWRHHARKAEAATRNACNCRLLLAALKARRDDPILGEGLASDATRYALEAQQHAAIARTFRDGFQPIKPEPRIRCNPSREPRRFLDEARSTVDMLRQVHHQFDQVGLL